MSIPFKVGDYITEHPTFKISSRSVYAILEIDKRGQLHIECCRSGNTWDMVEPSGYVRCKKPKTCGQLVDDLCKRFGQTPTLGNERAIAYRRFARELVIVLRDHGDSIHNL